MQDAGSPQLEGTQTYGVPAEMLQHPDQHWSLVLQVHCHAPPTLTQSLPGPHWMSQTPQCSAVVVTTGTPPQQR